MMLDIAEWEGIIVYILIISGIIIVLLVTNAIRRGIALGHEGWAMRTIKKEEKERSFWFNSISQLLMGILTIIFGILLYYY